MVLTECAMELAVLREDLHETRALLKLSQAENRLQKRVVSAVPNTECIACMQANVEVAFVPCGHCCICVPCAERMMTNVCPMCRCDGEHIRIFVPAAMPDKFTKSMPARASRL